MPADGALAGHIVVTLEARRASELARLLERHGATIVSAPALKEVPLDETPAAREFARRLAAGDVSAVVLLTGVGTRALATAIADEFPDFAKLLGETPIVARGPKPLAALRELHVAGARPVPPPHTWEQVVDVVDALALPAGALVAVQEYGAPQPRLAAALERRGLRVLAVPVYRWALPDDRGPLVDAARRLARGDADVVVFTSAIQVHHLFRVADDAAALRRGFGRVVVASIGPMCSEALAEHEVTPDLEADPPKLGPLAATIARDAPARLAARRGSA